MHHRKKEQSMSIPYRARRNLRHFLVTVLALFLFITLALLLWLLWLWHWHSCCG